MSALALNKLDQLRATIMRRLRDPKFLRNSSLLMLANIIVTGLGLIRTPTMAWLLPKEDVGMLAVVASWLPFVALLTLPGLDTATYHYLSKRRYWALAVNFSYRLPWSLLGAAVLLLGAAYWWANAQYALAWLFVVAAITLPFTNGLTAAGGVFSAMENFTGLFWYRLGESLTDFAGFVPLLFSVWWVSQAVTFYAANQLATIAMLIGVSWWWLRYFRRLQTPQPTAAEQQEMVTYGRHQTNLIGISVVQARVDPLLVSLFFPLTLVADYSIAQIVANQYRQLWGIYYSIRYPPLARMDRRQQWRRLASEGILIWLGFIGVGVLVYLAALWLIPWLLPPSYSSSIPYIAWLSAITIIGLPGGMAEVYFRLQQEERPQYKMRVVGAVASIVLPLLMMTVWGITGVVLGRLLANLAFSLYGVWLFVADRKVEG